MPAATPIYKREEIARRHESGETLAQIAQEMPLSVDCRDGILAVARTGQAIRILLNWEMMPDDGPLAQLGNAWNDEPL
ncbi:MAG: hypothetical protein H6671_15815 [Anaerolineaceae bacterium]|nr:hypothetical protein [Anaerolineaceae bacterium]